MCGGDCLEDGLHVYCQIKVSVVDINAIKEVLLDGFLILMNEILQIQVKLGHINIFKMNGADIFKHAMKPIALSLASRTRWWRVEEK